MSARRLRSCFPLAARGRQPFSPRALTSTAAVDGDGCSLSFLVDLFRDVPAADRNAALCSRIIGLDLARVSVAPSRVADAGLGLFASRAIASEELVTLYPCDALLQWPSEAQQGVGDVLVSLSPHSTGMGLKESEAFDPRSEHGAAAWRYSMRMSDTSSALANSNRIEDAAYLGHIANDGVVCEGPGTAAVRYATASAGVANVQALSSSLSDCHIALVALRPINQGDEILISYGAAYWLSRQVPSPRRHTFPDGSKYYGDVHGGKIDGQGEFTDVDGNRYVGQFSDGEYNGAGTYYLAGGSAEVSRYLQGREVGVGAAWSVDRQAAWRLVAASAAGGVTKPVEISLDDAASIAEELGLPVPPARNTSRTGARPPGLPRG